MSPAGRPAVGEGSPQPSAGRLVVGVGNPDRGDDTVGWVVAERLREVLDGGVRVLTCADPTDLVPAWSSCALAVVIDAVRSGRTPGELVVVETGADGPRLPDSSWAALGLGGTHAFGLGAAIELSRALRRLPTRVVVVGVEAASCEAGDGLSAPVAAAVPAVVEVVATLISEAR